MWQEALLRGSKGVGDTYDKKHFFEGAKGQEAHRGLHEACRGIPGPRIATCGERSSSTRAPQGPGGKKHFYEEHQGLGMAS